MGYYYLNFLQIKVVVVRSNITWWNLIERFVAPLVIKGCSLRKVTLLGVFEEQKFQTAITFDLTLFT